MLGLFFFGTVELADTAIGDANDLLVTAAMDLIGATEAMVGVAVEMFLLADGMSDGTMEMDGDFVKLALGLVENTINTTMKLGETRN